MNEPEFTVALSNDAVPSFVVYDRCAPPTNFSAVRSALERHRDDLACRLDAVERLLATGDPERTEGLMLDGASVRVERVVLRPACSCGPHAPDVAALERSLARRDANAP